MHESLINEEGFDVRVPLDLIRRETALTLNPGWKCNSWSLLAQRDRVEGEATWSASLGISFVAERYEGIESRKEMAMAHEGGATVAARVEAGSPTWTSTMRRSKAFIPIVRSRALNEKNITTLDSVAASLGLLQSLENRAEEAEGAP